MSRKALSIYIHVPFCRSRCGYCDFLTLAGADGRTDDYVTALQKDIFQSRDEFADHQIETVFLGGGTPSLLSLLQLADILCALRNNFNLAQNCHMSIEANPDTVSEEYLQSLWMMGFRRISFGVQSFDDGLLELMGRLHDAEKACNAVRLAHKAGFDDISLDLIFALPHQTLENFDKSLETALNLPITHISCYALSVEDGTPLAANKALVDAIPDDMQDRDMYALAGKKLAQAGFKHYEISNWAKVGFECRHNLSYWIGQEYLGLGLGASSYFGGKRRKKTDCLDDYISGNLAFAHEEEIDKSTQMAEFALLGLRLTEGISLNGFKNRFGQDIFDVYGEALNKFMAQGLLAQKGDKIALTTKGLDLSNTVFCDFL
ncbi:MAG: radical SAM family heme chaperone HemW [Defluviitaleaceae bacterium]|nr:radical SAM family heme chaperone HemW [Defluviitaleaceae bacterium]